MSLDTQTAPSSRAPDFQSLEFKLGHGNANVGIIGLGYVGLPLALLFTDAGFRVTGFDVDAQKVAKLSKGESYIYRVPSSEIQLACQKQFSATVDYSDIADMNANAKFNSRILRHIRVFSRHTALDLHRTTCGIDRACKFH